MKYRIVAKWDNKFIKYFYYIEKKHFGIWFYITLFGTKERAENYIEEIIMSKNINMKDYIVKEYEILTI